MKIKQEQNCFPLLTHCWINLISRQIRLETPEAAPVASLSDGAGLPNLMERDDGVPTTSRYRPQKQGATPSDHFYHRPLNLLPGWTRVLSMK